MTRTASTVVSFSVLALLGGAAGQLGCSAASDSALPTGSNSAGTYNSGSSGTYNSGSSGSYNTGSGGTGTSAGGSSPNSGGGSMGQAAAGGGDPVGAGGTGAGGTNSGSGGSSDGGMNSGGSGGKHGGHKGGASSGGTSSGGTSSGGTSAGGSSSGGSSSGNPMPLGQFVITWYSFQDNTPVNSSESASGRVLHAYTSVAVPFRLLKQFGGMLDYGDKLYLEYLHGKKMPNGMTHTGWVEIDDFCGDNSDDSYCYQTVGGKKYPNTDLYIGDFSKSGMGPSNGDCTGPAGNGQELTNVSIGDPGALFVTNYGGADLGSGKCGDYASAEAQQGGLKGGCWDYTPPQNTVAYCADCVVGVSCSSK